MIQNYWKRQIMKGNIIITRFIKIKLSFYKPYMINYIFFELKELPKFKNILIIFIGDLEKTIRKKYFCNKEVTIPNDEEIIL